MTDCAILAVASTTETVRAFLQRLVEDVVLDEQASVVPWTIVNKYYTAEVEFLVHPLSSWTSLQDELLAPALLFIWNEGEPYRDQVRKVSQRGSEHEFEVAIAIRLPSTGLVSPGEIEDDEDIDAYLSSKGFEFVDVPNIGLSSPDYTSIPGIPRVVDALSTIMWPSMVRRISKRATTTGFIDAVQANPGVSSDDYRNLVRLVGAKISGKDGDCMQRELEELESWLYEDTSYADARSADENDEAALWSTAVTPGTLSPSLRCLPESSRRTPPEAGFDDDFMSFVSASSPNSAGVPRDSSEGFSPSPMFPSLQPTSFSSAFSFDSASSGHSTPTFDGHASFDMTYFPPGESYKSLGSVPDFDDTEEVSGNLARLFGNGDEADEDMPSKIEIAETSRQIFGAMPLSLSLAQEQTDGDPRVGAPGKLPPQGHLSGERDVEMTDADLERFDLQSVLGALQGLKEEIAGLPDKERRKAAARVALGVAYGLDSNVHSAAGEEPN